MISYNHVMDDNKFREPNSTIFPKCITAIRSEIYLTIDKSCAINKKVIPLSFVISTLSLLPELG